MKLYLSNLAPMAHPRLDLFLLGYVVAVSAVAALFFLRFWKQTRDSLFLAFAVFFAVQGATRAFGLSTANPNQVVGWVYVLRLLSVVLVVIAILRKNFSAA
ncbi:MAG TPA: DUF5985 family protein [Acidobacteriaceae bacterium]|nr:DUF5985 family protein [Acidobacteriaceae bacterium]